VVPARDESRHRDHSGLDAFLRIASAVCFPAAASSRSEACHRGTQLKIPGDPLPGGIAGYPAITGKSASCIHRLPNFRWRVARLRVFGVLSASHDLENASGIPIARVRLPLETLPETKRMDFLSVLENMGISTWVRESGSVWSYPTIIFLHSVGMGLLVGLSAMIDLRLLGFAPAIPLAPLEKLFPLLWIGFAINAISGVLLLIADAGTFLVAPLFYGKLGLILVAVTATYLIRGQVRGAGVPIARVSMFGKVLAGTSLVFWAAAVTAGRLTAYIGPATALRGISH
jgi:hypothetical protein